LPFNTKAYYFPNATSQKNFTKASSLDIFGDVYYAAGEGDEALKYFNPDQRIYVKVGDVVDTTLIPSLTLEINDSNRSVFRWIRYRPIGEWAAYGPELEIEVNIPVQKAKELA